MGDRGNEGSADAVRQDRRHRRAGALSPSGSAEGELHACSCAAMGWSIPRASARRPARHLNLTAVIAPNAHAAAQYYPAGNWLSMMRIPEAGEFPGTGPQGNGINPNIKSQAEWMRMIKSGGCTACHQLGTKATREIPKELGTFPSLQHAWERRLASGQAGAQMLNGLNNLGKERALVAVRGLDRSDQSRRGAAGPGASTRRGAQRRDHDVGLGRSEGVPARRGVDRSPQSDRERQRPALRRARVERRLRAGARSEDPHDQPGSAHRSRSQHAADVAEDGRRPLRTSARSRSGPARTTFTTRCWTRRAGCG